MLNEVKKNQQKKRRTLTMKTLANCRDPKGRGTGHPGKTPLTLERNGGRQPGGGQAPLGTRGAGHPGKPPLAPGDNRPNHPEPSGDQPPATSGGRTTSEKTISATVLLR